MLVPVEHAIVDAGPKRADLEDEIGRLERHAARAAARRRRPARPGRPQPGRGVGAHDRHRPAPRRRRLRRAGPRAVDAQGHADAARVRGDDGVRRSAPTSSPTCAGRRCSTTSSSPRPTSRAGQGSAAAHPLRWAWVAIDQADLHAAAEPRWPSARTPPSCRAPRCCASRSGSRARRSPAASPSKVAAGRPTCSPPRADLSGEPARAPEGFVGELRSYQAEALAWLGLPRRRRPRRLPRPRHGPRQDADDARPPPRGRPADGPALVIAPPAVVGNWAAEAARFTPGLRVVVHHGPVAPRRRDRRRGRGGRRRDHHLRHRGARRRRHREGRVGDASSSTRRRPSRTRRTTRRSSCAASPRDAGRAHRHADRERSRRPVGDPRLHQPRPRRAPAAVHRQPLRRRRRRRRQRTAEDALRALNGILVFRRTKAEPEIAAELPDQIDELDHCAMTPEQIGLYQAVLDKLVAGQRPARGRGAAQGPDPRRHHRAQADLQPSRRVPGRRPAARRSLGQARRLEEIVDAVFAAGERVLVFTHFAEWGVKLAEHLTERTGTPIECYHGGLSRTASATA